MQPLLQGQLLHERTAERAASDGQLFARWEDDLEGKNPALEKAARSLRLSPLAALGASC